MSTKSRKRKADERAAKRMGKIMREAYDKRELHSYQKKLIEEAMKMKTTVIEIPSKHGRSGME